MAWKDTLLGMSPFLEQGENGSSRKAPLFMKLVPPSTLLLSALHALVGLSLMELALLGVGLRALLPLASGLVGENVGTNTGVPVGLPGLIVPISTTPPESLDELRLTLGGG